MDRNFVFMHLFDVHEPYLFIEDRSVDSKLNEDYFNAIGSIRNTINLKSKIDQRKRPHDSWQEIKEKMRSEGFDEKVILKSFYDMGVKKFDQYRLPEILDNFEKIGITQKNTLFIFLSDHGEGRSSFDIDNLHFSHGGDITEEVLRIFVSFSQKLSQHKHQRTNTISALGKLRFCSEQAYALTTYVSFVGENLVRKLASFLTTPLRSQENIDYLRT